MPAMTKTTTTKTTLNPTEAARKTIRYYTVEKAVHLFRVFIAIMSVSLLLVWQELIILRSLKVDAHEMAHLDPSEIIGTSFPLEKVASFTLLPVVTMLIFSLVRSPKKFIPSLLTWIKTSLFIFGLFGLCGDNLVKHWKISILTALYVGTLVHTTATGTITSNIAEEFPFQDMSTDPLSFFRLYGIIGFSIPSQLLTIFDHGSQSQRWPLPMLLGSTYGFTIGTILGLGVIYFHSTRNILGKRS